jgi:hypothetical protein
MADAPEPHPNLELEQGDRSDMRSMFVSACMIGLVTVSTLALMRLRAVLAMIVLVVVDMVMVLVMILGVTAIVRIVSVVNHDYNKPAPAPVPVQAVAGSVEEEEEVYAKLKLQYQMLGQVLANENFATVELQAKLRLDWLATNLVSYYALDGPWYNFANYAIRQYNKFLTSYPSSSYKTTSVCSSRGFRIAHSDLCDLECQLRSQIDKVLIVRNRVV